MPESVLCLCKPFQTTFFPSRVVTIVSLNRRNQSKCTVVHKDFDFSVKNRFVPDNIPLVILIVRNHKGFHHGGADCYPTPCAPALIEVYARETKRPAIEGCNAEPKTEMNPPHDCGKVPILGAGHQPVILTL